MYAKERLRKARREARLYIRFALGQVKRFEWIGTLALVAVCMALILIEFAPWFFDVARRFKDVLMWGK
jgi:predicted lysophospholipase L1 biosynthesis ABC-type transport system permease subunit